MEVSGTSDAGSSPAGATSTARRKVYPGASREVLPGLLQ
jgi:hypothetical protein